ncbi:MAG: hypothetical protein KIT11_08035 [Fimbriimonadaceae bacterium]|nr:hypothetical protein [Fimbriimonadaceae bacterium]QYK56303.1 MAG: hypothetical protein KF733_02230 [Fimbriimonadaceae bacterium]
MSRGDLVLLGAALFTAMMLRAALTPVFVPDREREFDARVEYRGLSDSLVVVQPAQSVKVMATGSADDLDQLDTDTVQAVVDLTQAVAGERSYPVEIAGPVSSRVKLGARFGTLRLDIQKVDTLQRTVELEQSGLPPPAYVVEGGTIEPPEVTIFGPEKSLPEVKRVRVILNLNEVRPGGSYLVPVEVLGEKGKPVPMVRVQPAQVTVTPAVAAAQPSKRVLVSPNWVGQLPFGYKLKGYQVKPSQVQVRGDSSDLAQFVSIDTAPIDLSAMRKTTTVSTKLNVPGRVRTVGEASVEVTVEIEGPPEDQTPRAEPERPGGGA